MWKYFLALFLTATLAPGVTYADKKAATKAATPPAAPILKFEGPLNKVDSKAVSYTHLTLPTNREV